jgi:hypothetical protein
MIQLFDQVVELDKHGFRDKATAVVDAEEMSIM